MSVAPATAITTATRHYGLRRACILWVAMSVARLVTLFFSKVALSLAGSKLSLT